MTMSRSHHQVLAAVFLFAAGLFAAGALQARPDKEAAREIPKTMNGLPLVFHEDFQKAGAAARFDYLDPDDWKVTRDGDRPVLSLFRIPKGGRTPHRSPFGRALIKDLYVGPFVLEAKLRSTVKDYPHRDMCLFFGALDDSHLYYVHLGKKPDPHAGNVFIVDNADRKAIAPIPKQGIDWTDNYHTVRLVREAGGAVEVFFDGKSWLKADARTFLVGRVGVGSFDDTGNFAEITVWGKKADKPAAPEKTGK
jgi:hypothetical protein